MSTADIATIGLAVDTSGIKSGVQELDKLADAGDKVQRSANGLRGSFSNIAQGLKEGVAAGMEEARQQIDRTSKILESSFKARAEMAAAAQQTLGIRGESEIRAELKSTEQAYRDLRDAGLSSSSELSRAKDAMRDKVRELRTEMGHWDRDWEKLGGRITEVGNKMAMMGAKGMVVGAPAILAGKRVIDAEHELFKLANTAGVAGNEATAAIERWDDALSSLAKSTNQTKTELIGAMQTLVGKGMSPDESLKALKQLGDAATGTSAQINDLAISMFANYENLKVPVMDTARALDMMAEAGNRGSFELKNMAEFFPVMTNAAAMAGMQGTDAIAQLAAAGQISRRAASDASSAAGNVRDFLMKLKTPETAKYFSEFGVDISAEVKKGIESGDLIGYMGQVLRDMQKKNPDVISNVFRDLQAKTFATKLVADLEDYKQIRDAALGAVGTVEKQKETIMKSTSEKVTSANINLSTAIEDSKILQAVLDKIKSVTEWFSQHPEIFGALATLITTIAASSAALAIAGTALSVIGTAVTVIATAASAGLLAAAATAIAAIAGVVAAWKVGFAFGTWINEQINTAVEAITGTKGMTLGSALYDMIEGENGLIPTLKSFPDKVAGTWAAIKEAGAKLAQAFQDGFRSVIARSIGLAEKLAEMSSLAKAKVREWYQIGVDTIMGLWEGMKATLRKPIEAVQQLAKDLPGWARDLLGIKSPSKVFKEIGENIGIGMELGILGAVPDVQSAAEKLSKAAITGGYLEQYEPALDAGRNGSTVPESVLWTSKASVMSAPTDRELEALARRAEILKRQLRDPLDEALDKFAEYDLMLANNLITQKEYAAAIAETTLAMKEYTDQATLLPKDARNNLISQRFMEGATFSQLAKEFQLSEAEIEKLIRKTNEADEVFGELRLTVEDAFETMEDSFKNFIDTGEANFDDFTETIIDGIERMASEWVTEWIRALMNPIVTSGMDWVFDAFSSMVGGMFMKNGAAMTNGSVQAFASGGILGPTGGLLTQPTVFPMANGGIGIGGEAGTEAVMPLTRDSSGVLGVKASGAGNNVVVNVVESPGNGGQTRERTEGNTRIVDVLVEQIKSAVAQDFMTGGNIAKSAERTYGLNRAAGAY